MLHHAVDYTPYEGRTLGAWPAYTIARGDVVWDGMQFLGTPGRGRFLPRGLPTMVPRKPSGNDAQ
jgi:dihydropyrimidinase